MIISFDNKIARDVYDGSNSKHARKLPRELHPKAMRLLRSLIMLPKYRPPTHPGEMLLKEFLEPLNIRQSEFARHVGWSYNKLNEIIRGRRNITVGSALALGEALQTGPLFWLNLQRDWDLWHSLRKHRTVPPISQENRAFANRSIEI